MTSSTYTYHSRREPSGHWRIEERDKDGHITWVSAARGTWAKALKDGAERGAYRRRDAQLDHA